MKAAVPASDDQDHDPQQGAKHFLEDGQENQGIEFFHDFLLRRDRATC
jgi:hypothetical protein